jgi:hypothetical protein
MFRILNSSDIDFQAWDSCVSNSKNASLYGKSWYLNILAGEWKGIVKGNYDAVFPLFARQKLGLRYICQPMGIPSVAWYSASNADPLDYAILFNYISSRYVLAEFNLIGRTYPSSAEQVFQTGIKFRVKQYLNFQHSDFTHIKDRFSRGHKYAIRHAMKHSTRIVKKADASAFWEVTRRSIVYNSVHDYHQNRKRMEVLVGTALSNNTGQIWTAYLGDTPVSSAFLIEANKVLYFIFLFTLERGRTQCVNHLMVQEIIKHNCSQVEILDFGGSDIKSIALFNRGFGTSDHYYLAIISGRMCNLISMIKALAE